MPAPAAIVTDIEGTTSSLSFVHQVLFPYSRARLADYATAHAAELADIFDAVRALEGAPSLSNQDAVAVLERWHDADRKAAPLKDLQARIWEQGFRSGAFRGHAYPDAVAALRRWHSQGLDLYVYSSGAVAAQRLLFGFSEAGDLTPLFAGHFDTTTGAKRDPASYAAIAAATRHAPSTILFLSDVAEELEAAATAGLRPVHVVREGQATDARFPAVASFDAIDALFVPA